MAAIVTAMTNLTRRICIDDIPQAQKNKLHEMRLSLKTVSTIALVASVALSVLNIIAVSSGFVFSGMAPMILSLPSSYFFYNLSQVCDNTKDIIESSSTYRMIGKSGEWDIDKMTTQLNKNTFLFNDIVDIALQTFIEEFHGSSIP